jgi:hypothetical protein
MDTIMCAVLHEAHERQVDKSVDTLKYEPERFYKSYLDD